MTTWILVMIAFAGGGDGGVTSQQIAFESAAKCEAARSRVLPLGARRDEGWVYPTVIAVCVAK